MSNEEKVTLPVPLGWKILVRPKQPKKMSTGGIAMPGEVTDAEQAMTYVGQVEAIGEAAFMATTQGGINMTAFKVKPKVGDWIVYAPFAGQKMRMKGDDTILILMNDTEVQAVIDEPDSFWSWIDA